MITVAIPGHKDLNLRHLVLDYNGTLACDGEILDGLGQPLSVLAEQLQIHVVTADTFGKAASQWQGYPGQLVVLPAGKQDVGKLDYVRRLGPESTAAIGNGRNDRLMLREATLGMALIQREGAAAETVLAADIVCCDILAALELLANPKRLVATLRS